MAMSPGRSGVIAILLAACGGKQAAPPPVTPSPAPVTTTPTSAPAASAAQANHDALAKAGKGPDALWALVNPQRGLRIRSPDGETIACTAADLAARSVPFAAAQPWRCNASLSRCISGNGETGDTLYYYREGRLDTVVATESIYLDSNEQEIAGVLSEERGPCFAKRLGTAEDIRATLVATLAAKPFQAFMAGLIDPKRGLLLHDAHDDQHRVVCSADAFASGVRPFEIWGSWACDASAKRCTTADPDGGGFAFVLRDGTLDAVIQYRGKVPADDGPRAKALLAADRTECGFGTELASIAAVVMDSDEPVATLPTDLWVYTHPTWFTDDSEGMEGPSRAKLPAHAKTEHLCGAKATARARELLREVGAPEPVCHVGPMSCSFHAASDAIGAELRVIPGRDAKSWVVARLGPLMKQPKTVEAAVAGMLAKTAKTAPCK